MVWSSPNKTTEMNISSTNCHQSSPFLSFRLESFITFCTNYSKSSYVIAVGAAIILNRGGGHTKADCHANYTNCDSQCWSLSRYLFYLHFKAFPKRNDVSTRKGPKRAFSWPAAIFFLHTTVHLNTYPDTANRDAGICQHS